jgi:hypothetical protein
MSVEFVSMLSGAVWVHTNVYVPCTPEGKINSLNLLHDIVMPDDTDWLLVGVFNLIRKASDQNRLDGNIQEMLRLNEVISNMRLEELHLQGHQYTWTNKQVTPILERLD